MKVDLTLTEMTRLLEYLDRASEHFDVGDRDRLRSKLSHGVIRHNRERKTRRNKDEVTWDQWVSYMDDVPGLIRWGQPTTPTVAKHQYWKTPWRHPFMLKVRRIFEATNRTYSPYDILIRTIDNPERLEFTAKMHGSGTRPLQL